jgi:hypothetical protein
LSRREVPDKLPVQIRIRFEANPPAIASAIKISRVRANARAYFKDVAGEEWPQLTG